MMQWMVAVQETLLTLYQLTVIIFAKAGKQKMTIEEAGFPMSQ